MSIKSLFTIIVFCLSITSCRLESTPTELQADFSQAKVINVPISKDSLFLDYKKFAIGCISIPLKGHPGIHIGTIQKMDVLSDSSFIIFDGSQVFHYSSNGEFLNLIGEKGHGHGEYISPMDFTYNIYDNLLYIYDFGTSTMLTYTIEGKFLKKENIDFHAGGFSFIDDKNICFYTGFSKLKTEKFGYNYKITNKEYRIKALYEKFSGEYFFIPSCNHIFSRNYKGELLCQSPNSNCIFKLQDNTIVPKYVIQCDENHPIVTGTPDELIKHEIEPNGNICNRFFESEHYYIINLTIASGFYNYIVVEDKINGEIYAGKQPWNIYLGIEPSFLSPSLCKDNKLYGILYPDDYEQAVSMFKQSMPNTTFDLSELEKIAKGKNPVIQILSLK